jgi:hypothetical protein
MTKRVVYDRIKIREKSYYWNRIAINFPPMSYDSTYHLLTIYGQGVRQCEEKGISMEQYCEYFLNHEILHDIIMNVSGKQAFLQDLRMQDHNMVHWPFYWGIDLLDDMWFATGIRLITGRQGYSINVSPEKIKERLQL